LDGSLNFRNYFGYYIAEPVYQGDTLEYQGGWFLEKTKGMGGSLFSNLQGEKKKEKNNKRVGKPCRSDNQTRKTPCEGIG